MLDEVADRGATRADPDGRRRRARPPGRAPVLARGPAAAGATARSSGGAQRARRDRPGAARGVHPPRRGDARGRAGHRQDTPAARRGRARRGERVHLRRDHGRRGDPRAVPRRAEPVRLDRDPRHRRGNAGGGRASAASSMPSPGATSPGSRPCRRMPSSSGPSTSRASRSSTLARIQPLALFIDDVQWADDDTLRLLRYVVRSDADRPIFLFLTIRPDEFATVTEAVNFVADMERMGLVRRLRPGRFSSVETAELLKRVLGGPVEAASATAMHVQSEGVPFIVEELARTHREAGTLQQIDGEWRLGRNAARLVPSAVRTLIDRRAARLPAPTRAALGDAAILGRSFSLRDLRAIQARIGAGASAGSAVRRATGETPTSWPTISPRPSRRASCSPRLPASPRTTRSPTSRSASSPRAQLSAGPSPAGPRRGRRPAARRRRSGSGRPADARPARPRGRRHGPCRTLLDRRGDRRPRVQCARGGAPARRAGAAGRVVAGRPTDPPRDPRRRVRRPAQDRRAARRPDRARRPGRGDARSRPSRSTSSSGARRRSG